MMKHVMVVFVLLIGSGCLMAQANSAQSPNDKKGQVTLKGCVSRQSGDYILMQADPSVSYVLHSGSNVKLGDYLGQQVKVTGTKSSTLSDSSDAARSAPPTTITVNSINTISKECKP